MGLELIGSTRKVEGENFDVLLRKIKSGIFSNPVYVYTCLCKIIIIVLVGEWYCTVCMYVYMYLCLDFSCVNFTCSGVGDASSTHVNGYPTT